MNTHSRVHGATKKERESFWMLVCICVLYPSHPRAEDGRSSRLGHRGARGEEPVASASGSVRERGEGEDPVMMCCASPAYLFTACSAEFILRTPRSRHTAFLDLITLSRSQSGTTRTPCRTLHGFDWRYDTKKASLNHPLRH
jgi:hypothetical protein